MKKIILLFVLCTISFRLAFADFAMPPVTVQTAVAKEIPWQQQTQATGSLAALQGIMVKPEIAGRISKIYFQPGAYVQEGAPLVVLNQAILQAKLDLNQANLKLSAERFERMKALWKQHAISKEDYDTAEANLIKDRANVAEARAELEQATIRAPFSGKLGLNLVNVGDYVTEGQSIVNLQALDPIVVNFSVPENYLSKISIGSTVTIHSDAFPQQTFTGKIYAFDSVVNADNRSLAVRATIPNKENQLLPGMFVEVSLSLGEKEKVIAIPQTALVSTINGAYVYRIVEGKAIKTAVVVQSRNDQTVIIKQGLHEGDVVVTDGQFKITNSGDPVAVAGAGATEKKKK